MWASELYEQFKMPLHEKVEVYLLFVNTTNRDVDLYCASNPCTWHLKLSLRPNQGAPVDTYNTHIWFFVDCYTGERMHVQSQRLFYPIRKRVSWNPQKPDELRDVRSRALIHFPMRTLKENCLWSIARRFKLIHEQTEYIIRYDSIPVTLKSQLLNRRMDMFLYYREAQHNRHRRWMFGDQL